MKFGMLIGDVPARSIPSSSSTASCARWKPGSATDSAIS